MHFPAVRRHLKIILFLLLQFVQPKRKDFLKIYFSRKKEEFRTNLLINLFLFYFFRFI